MAKAKRLIDEAAELPPHKMQKRWIDKLDPDLREQVNEVIDRWNKGEFRKQWPYQQNLADWIGLKVGRSGCVTNNYITARRTNGEAR